jgi:hypothetical protein
VIITDQIAALDDALDTARIPHAFGGALALAWCTRQARGTIDIDVNLFIPPSDAAIGLAALPPGVAWGPAEQTLLERDGQARLRWDETPVDLFLNTERFHVDAQSRIRWEPFLGRLRPFLACRDLAVFKAFFNRTKDWADLEAMAEAGCLDVEAIAGVLVAYLGGDDERIARLRDL